MPQVVLSKIKIKLPQRVHAKPKVRLMEKKKSGSETEWEEEKLIILTESWCTVATVSEVRFSAANSYCQGMPKKVQLPLETKEKETVKVVAMITQSESRRFKNSVIMYVFWIELIINTTSTSS